MLELVVVLLARPPWPPGDPDPAAQRDGPGTFDGYRIDVETDPRTVATFEVTSIPTVVLLRNRHEVARLDGLIRPEDLHAMIADATSPGQTDAD